MGKILIHRTRLYVFCLLTALVLQQGCNNQPAGSPPPLSQIAQEGATVEPPKSKEPEVLAELKLPPTPTVNAPKPLPQAPPKIAPPESLLGRPEKNSATSMLKYDTVVASRTPDTPAHLGWQYRKNQQGQIVGFEFSNYGGNRILPPRRDIDKHHFFTRDFQFRFDERARQDIHLYVSDWVPSRDKRFRLSEIMNSILLFFPRTYLPAITREGDRIIVTLPTGEKVVFDALTHEIRDGVFSEAPVDLNPDKAARKFAGVIYRGKGVVVTAEARGSDPRLGTLAAVTSGSPPSACLHTRNCQLCRIPAKELWEQKGAVRFKFSNDEAFNRYLQQRCGFGFPEKILG